MTRRGIVGAGAQGRVLLEVWRAQYPGDEFAFYDDDPSLHGQSILGASVVGPVDLAAKTGVETLLAVGNNRVRLALAERLSAAGARFGRAVHPTAFVSPSAHIAPGTVVFAGAIVNTQAHIHEHVIINTGTIVEHDCVIGAGASLSPGVRMGGRVSVGRGAFLSTGVTLGARASVGEGTVVGAGAVVVSHLPAQVLAWGVPARVIRPLGDDFAWKSVL